MKPGNAGAGSSMVGHSRKNTGGTEEFSPPIQIRLTRRQWDYISGGVKAGRWGTVSEAIRAGVFTMMKSEGKA